MKLFDSFILIHYDCVRGMVTSFIRYLSRFGFSFFKLKWKTKNKLQIWISMFSYFENRKSTYFDVLRLNFSIETRIKTLYYNFIFQFIEKTKWHFGYTDSKQCLCRICKTFIPNISFCNITGNLEHFLAWVSLSWRLGFNGPGKYLGDLPFNCILQLMQCML